MTWIQTRSGKAFNLVEPEVDQVDFSDIAHALSQVCRFGGHTIMPFSVAEHSLRVAAILPKEIRAYGLLHDAHEAYVGDVTTPLKGALGHGWEYYKTIENRIASRIHEAAGLTWPLPAAIQSAVRFADIMLMMTERRDVLGAPIFPWGDEYEAVPPLEERIVPMDAQVAKFEFLFQLRSLAPAAFDSHCHPRVS